jgi:hypothetical protein
MKKTEGRQSSDSVPLIAIPIVPNDKLETRTKNLMNSIAESHYFCAAPAPPLLNSRTKFF